LDTASLTLASPRFDLTTNQSFVHYPHDGPFNLLPVAPITARSALTGVNCIFHVDRCPPAVVSQPCESKRNNGKDKLPRAPKACWTSGCGWSISAGLEHRAL